MRVLVASFGSAGDVFPLVPVVDRLRARGDDVLVATPRSTGLYLRLLGLRTLALGDGGELAVFDDGAAVSDRFGGWGSWHRTVTRYVCPTLASDLAAIERVAATWAPDVVVASGFAAAARLFARRSGVPLVDLGIYPQHAVLAEGGHRFALRFRREVARLLGTDDRAAVSRVAWGVPGDALLHDTALLGPPVGATPVVGYPYWDDLPHPAVDDDQAAEACAGGETVVVTFGSFLGRTQRDRWTAIADALVRSGRRVLLVGPPRDWGATTFGERSEITAVPFVPLSAVLPEAAAVVHHGGLGTSMAAVRARVPALVVPLAYDQPSNAALLAAAGVVRPTTPATVAADLAFAGEPGPLRAVAALAAALVPTDRAAAAAVAVIDDALRRPAIEVVGG